ncbi:MAG: hypothetical protein ACJ0QK_00570, partial [Flavobacteriales bacterium]
MKNKYLILILTCIFYLGANSQNNVTFQVDMSTVDPTTFTTPEVNGTFNGWCGNCASMSDLDGDNVWDVTIDLANGTYEFKYSADNWTIQESLFSGESCTNGNTQYTNRMLTVSGDTTLPVVCWSSCSGCNSGPSSYNVTFELDMRGVTDPHNTPEVNGDFNSWCGNCWQMSDADGDSIWQFSASFVPGDTLEWKYSADNWSIQEDLDSNLSCITINYDPGAPNGWGFVNRLAVVNSDTIFSSPWQACDGIGGGTGQPLSQIDLPITWDDTTVDYTVTDFGGNSSSLTVDPLDPSNNVIMSDKTSGAQTWAGTTLGSPELLSSIPFVSGSTTISAHVYSPSAGTVVRLKAEDHTDPTKSVETEATTTVANGWNTLVFDFANEAPGTAMIDFSYNYDMLSIFYDFGNNGVGDIYYLDSVSFGGLVSGTPGCTDPLASNYDPLATIDDGSCLYSTTFNVDMNCEPAGSFGYVHLESPVFGWCGGCVPMSDPDGDGVHSVTVDLAAGNFEYKYAVDGFAGQENLIDDMLAGGTCAPITDYSSYANRLVTVAPGLTTSDTYGSCDACVLGCTDPLALNYDSLATTDDGSCVLTVDLSLQGIIDFTVPSGGSNGKAIHLVALQDIPDLSIYGIGVANNGGGTDGEEYVFDPISVLAGDDVLLARSPADMSLYFDACYIEFDHVLTASSSISQNGDDAIELFLLGNVVETFGDINVDGTGTPWEYMDSWAYKDTSGTVTFSGGNWMFGGVNCTDGSTTTFNSSCPYPLCPITGTLGCTDSLALNYDSLATIDDGSCLYPVYGCTDSLALNYNPLA